MRRTWAIIVIFGGLLVGCHGEQGADGPGPSAGGSGPAAVVASESIRLAGSTPATALATLERQVLTDADLRQALLEAAGGQVLAELVLDRQVGQRLGKAGLKLEAEHLAGERQALLGSLADQADEAERLLAELRRRRGWGLARFDAMLRRNAGLRLLIRDQVKVGEPELRQAFEMEYGPRYEVRLVLVPTLAKAAEVVRRARAGESFLDLALKESTDASRAQGGLLPPISPADPTFPAAVRTAAPKLTVAQVSDPIALERSFAVLRLERKIDAAPVHFDDVKAELAPRVRRQTERLLMQRLARELVSQADLTVLDPALRTSWEEHKRVIFQD